MSMTFLVWLILSTIWGSTWLFIKIGLRNLPPFTFAGIRFVIAAFAVLILLLVRRPSIPKSSRDWGLIFFTGFIIFGVNYGLVFWGENHISSGLTAILYTTFPFFGLVIAHFFLPAEPMTVTKTAGVLLGITGVAIIFWKQVQVQNIDAIWGSAAVVFASLVTAYANVLIKRHAKHIDPFVMTSGQMAIGLVPLLLVGFVFEGNPSEHHWNSTSWLAVFYLALVGSSLAFVLLYWLIQRMDVTKTNLIPLASTVIAVILGRIFLGEELGLRTSIGGASILTGLLLAAWGYKQVEERKHQLNKSENSYHRQA